MAPNVSSVLDRAPVQTSAAEQGEVERFRHSLADIGNGQGPALITPSGTQIPIPPSIYRVLTRLVYHMARGDAVSLVPYHQEVTTQEAADILNMSRPSLIRILDRGEIPYTKTGTHRRLLLHDVLEYQKRRSKERRAALDRITRKSEELGLY